jgi:hypothetical protein
VAPSPASELPPVLASVPPEEPELPVREPPSSPPPLELLELLALEAASELPPESPEPDEPPPLEELPHDPVAHITTLASRNDDNQKQNVSASACVFISALAYGFGVRGGVFRVQGVGGPRRVQARVIVRRANPAAA